MPAPSVIDIECVQKPIEGRKWYNLDWRDGLRRHLEGFGYNMYEADKRMPRPLERTSVEFKREMYYWLPTCQRQEYAGLIKQLWREARVNTKKKVQLEVQWVDDGMKKRRRR